MDLICGTPFRETHMPRQDDLNTVFTSELTALKGRIEMTVDALNAIAKVLGPVLDRLSENDPKLSAANQDYRSAMARLRKEGLRERHETPAQTECPQCHAKIRVEGLKGDRCDWCGYVFPLRCPSCKRELNNIQGEPGETCLWCRHEF
jgi:hypothetical protein